MAAASEFYGAHGILFFDYLENQLRPLDGATSAFDEEKMVTYEGEKCGLSLKQGTVSPVDKNDSKNTRIIFPHSPYSRDLALSSQTSKNDEVKD